MNRLKRLFINICLLIGLLGLSGCSSPNSVSGDMETTAEVSAVFNWPDMVPVETMELKYAENFSVESYEGGYRLLVTKDGTKLLTIPEGMDVPENLDEDIAPIRQPVKDLYLVSSSVMNIFSELDALDSISLSGQKAENWYIEEAKEAMEREIGRAHV